jgi:hypothetical protein
MPFLTMTTENDPKKIHLEQVAPNLFRLRRAFRYREPDGLGVLEPKAKVIPRGLKTDLASVPWPFWWLIASYGRHTKAVLLHDSLINDGMTQEDRRDADRLLFVSLKESGFGSEADRQTSWARRWLMWSAVALFGTMKEYTPFRLVLFVVHLLLFLGLLGYVTVVHIWPAVDLVIVPFVFLGSGLWGLVSDAAGCAASLWPFEWAPEVWHVAAAVGLLGLLWARHPAVDTALGLGLWPWAIIGTIVVVPPTVLILIAIIIIAAVDLPSSASHGVLPVVTPTRELSGALPALDDEAG